MNSFDGIKINRTAYKMALRCPKSLWLESHCPEKAGNCDEIDAKTNSDNEVKELASGYFGDYKSVDATKGDDYALKQTKKLVDSNVSNIAGGVFSVGNITCNVDLLHKTEHGWDIIDIKGSTQLYDEHIDDMAFQHYVLSSAGVNISGVYNIHINSSYVRYGEIDMNELLVFEDCTSLVLDRQKKVERNIYDIIYYMENNATDEPASLIGMRCDGICECKYKGCCLSKLPKPSVFDIQGKLNNRQKYELFGAGIVSFADVIDKNAKLSDDQILKVKMECYDLPAVCKWDKINSYLNELSYPLYFLNFETIKQAVPRFDGAMPYMSIPFQYSLHAYKYREHPLEHYEFLGKEGTDPRRELALSLCEDIPFASTIMVSDVFETKQIINDLLECCPEMERKLLDISNNIRDLMEPIKKLYYYKREFQGGCSIERLLPVLCPNDPELDSYTFDEIANDYAASKAFSTLDKLPPDKLESKRENLLEYCSYDTLAMAKVFDEFRKICA